MRIIRAIIDGERDPLKLVVLCHECIQKEKRTDVLKSLEGHYHQSYILLLKENLRLWDEHQESIRSVEEQIAELLDKLNHNKQMEVSSPSKPARHHHPQIKDLHKTMVQLYDGVSLTSITGINDCTMLRLAGEIGFDMSRFPTVKHFVSWLGLSPKNKQNGKMKKRLKSSANKAGLILRQSAQSLMNSKNSAIGVFIKRLKGRKGAAVAIKAGARKLAIALYNALTKGMDYVEQGAEKYTAQIEQRELRLLKKLAVKHNYHLIDYHGVIV